MMANGTDRPSPDMRLTEYALGTLTPGEAAEVEALLERSEEARAELRALREALVGLTEALPQQDPPEHVWHGLQKRLERSHPSPIVSPDRPLRPNYLGWALAACLVLLALGEGLWLRQSRQSYQEAARDTQLVTAFLSASSVERRPLYGREREAIGSVLTTPQGEALFVLGETPSEERVYQAWGHSSDDWEPGSDARLTSLGVSDDAIFAVATRDFSALYLSLEPRGGSPQPTFAISRMSLDEPVAHRPLSITSPGDGAVLGRETVIVTGVVAANVTNLSYVLNGNSRQTTVSGSRFSFTITLERGQNTLIVRAQSPQGTTRERLTLTRR